VEYEDHPVAFLLSAAASGAGWFMVLGDLFERQERD